MTFPNGQLLLDRFVAYNKVRYKDNPVFVGALSNLTADQVIFSNLRKQPDVDNQLNYLVDMEAPNLFIATDQGYIPADFVTHGPAILADPVPVALASLVTKTVPGIYVLINPDHSTTGAVLTAYGFNTAPAVKQLIQTNSQYVLLDTDITIDINVTIATIDSQSIVGTMAIAEMNGVALYDGTFIHDGTINY